MIVTWQTVITFASVLTAIAAVARMYNKGYDWVKRQDEQDKRLESIQEEHDKKIMDIMSEQSIIINGVLACLKGLQEQGCDGSVTEAIASIEQYLNEKAHK